MSAPYLTRLDVADHDENVPVDALAKRVIASNLNHLANSHGQVLVNWGVGDGNGVAREIVVGTGYLWASAEMPLRMRPDGSAFSWRIRLRGRRVSGSATMTFHVGVNAVGLDREQFTTSSSTSAWLTPVGDALLEINAAQVATLRQGIASPQVLGGAPIAHPETMARVYVYATGVGTNTVELTGLYVSEFIGA